MRPLLVEADWGRMLIDCGAGDKMDAKSRDIYGLDPEHGLRTGTAGRLLAWMGESEHQDAEYAGGGAEGPGAGQRLAVDDAFDEGGRHRR